MRVIKPCPLCLLGPKTFLFFVVCHSVLCEKHRDYHTPTKWPSSKDLAEVSARLTLESRHAVESLFEKYAENSTWLSLAGLESLMGNLGLVAEDGDEDHHHEADDSDDHRVEGHDHGLDDHHLEDHTVHDLDTYHVEDQGAGDPDDAEDQGADHPGHRQIDQSATMLANATRETGTPTETRTADPTDPSHPQNENQTDEYPGHWMQTCLEPQEMLRLFGQPEGLNYEQFLLLSPIMVYQIDSQLCLHDPHPTTSPTKSDAQVWGYSVLAVTLISLVSVCGIAVVPLMKRYPRLYLRLLSYLIAMAIGTLVGDATLHLIPHAFGIHGDGDHGDHDDQPHGGEAAPPDETLLVWKGSMVLVGVFFFFLMERLMHIRTQKCRKTPSASVHFSGEGTMDSEGKVGERLAQHSYRNSFHCTESFMVTSRESLPAACCEEKEKLNAEAIVLANGGGAHQGAADAPPAVQMEGGHSHSHSHSHAEGAGGRLAGMASIAWMVILGDGLHNCIDGLAMGAAFTDSITGGLSTSIAVFCHELPHELGDFALLLSSGMTWKQALGFAGVSSVLSYLGMVVGILLGSHVDQAGSWIFGLAAGIFLYIALVDMMPEIMHAENVDGPWCHLVLQSLGLLSGFAIMVSIAMYEHDLANVLGSA